MEAIILAGGFGKRIQSVVSDVPKPMAPVAGKPFLYYILKSLIRQDIQRIILAVGYKWEAILDYFGNKFESADLLYAVEEQPLGTGGGIRKALELVKGDEAIVINGDTYFDLPLQDLIAFHHQGTFDLTMSLKPLIHFDRYGTVVLDGNRVVEMKEKQPCEKGLINGGVYLIKKKILEKHPANTKFSFENEILEKEVDRLKIGGYIDDSYFIDIGIPEDYSKAQQDFEKSKKKKALFLDRDGVVNVDKNYVYKIEEVAFIDGIFKFCQHFQHKGFHIFIITNQAGIARGFYSTEDFINLSDWMVSQFKEKDVRIDKIYFCPHHPEITGPCNCRKPEPGMILQAEKEFDLDLSESILVGNNKSDLEAGEHAGIRKNYLFSVPADFLKIVEDESHQDVNNA